MNPKVNRYGDFTTKSGVTEKIQINTLNSLSNDRILVALQRLKKIVQSEPLDGYDDTTPGRKSTECSWGFCSESKELWPDAKDHIFPYDFISEGRITPLSYKGKCPMQMEKGNGSGCFYYCRFFKSTIPKPLHTEYLLLVEAKIKELEIDN